MKKVQVTSRFAGHPREHLAAALPDDQQDNPQDGLPVERDSGEGPADDPVLDTDEEDEQLGDDQPLHPVAEGGVAPPFGGELEPHGEDHAGETENGDNGADEGDGVAETEDPGVGVPTVYK